MYTDRQTDRQTDSQADRQTRRGTDRQAGGQAGRHTTDRFVKPSKTNCNVAEEVHTRTSRSSTAEA